MTKLNVEVVKMIFFECLFHPHELPGNGEFPPGTVTGEGAIIKAGFHPERLAAMTPRIGELLAELPDNFHHDKGGGFSFLHAHEDRHGNHWGEHRDIDDLLALGTATKQATFLMPRDMWNILPGGMPYFVIHPPGATVATLAPG